MDSQQIPTQMKEYVLELAMSFMNSLYINRRSMAYADFGTFVHFLKLIQRGINVNLIDLNLRVVIENAFKSAYGPKSIKYAIQLDIIISSVRT